MSTGNAKPDITIVKAETGDWIGLYLNGRLVLENHSINLDEGLRVLGIDFLTVPEYDLKDDGQFPYNESDLRVDALDYH